MSHFAEIDENGIVLRVLVGDNNSPNEGKDFFDQLGGTWIQTSYNANFRAHYAGVGMIYDAELDAFYAPQPYPSWTLDKNCNWQPPTPIPDGEGWIWNETDLEWQK